MSRIYHVAILLVQLSTVPQLWAYPVDEYERTGIRRLEQQRLVFAGQARGTRVPEGGRWTSERISLRLLEVGRDYELGPDTPKDPVLQPKLAALLRKPMWRAYGVALLDISDPAAPRYAAVREDLSQTPGSVSKVLIAAGMLRLLAERFGDDIPARETMLRETMVEADEWAMPNSHEVPIISGENLERASWRRVLAGDSFNLWEWMDHALSASSNAAASILWREATLMSLLGEDYPPAARDAELFERWEREAFTEAAFAVVDEPLRAAGLDPDGFQLRRFFTRRANRYIRPEPARMTPLAGLQWLLRIEQGRMVDEFSSLELKKLLYLTRRRVRYLHTPVLNDSAAYFKSGSLFRCKPEPDFTCIQYQGNVINALNALIGIETAPPDVVVTDAASDTDDAITDGGVAISPELARPPHAYLVVVMSNELRRNAALDHAALGAEIHRIVLEP